MTVEIKNSRGVVLREVPGANMDGANLRSADLSSANLSGANMRNADLRDANLFGANLRDADLSSANLDRADLSGANLRNADLRDANLFGANLREANLPGAALSSANLSGANLRNADLRGANLFGANLRDANLSGADLSGANLSGAELPQFQIAPEAGAFEAYKAVIDSAGERAVIRIRIPSEAARTSALGRRQCRAEYVEVLEGEGWSPTVGRDLALHYVPGQTVRADKYDPDIRVVCTGGIHFYMTAEEAQDHL